jgi:hypothetical protein
MSLNNNHPVEMAINRALDHASPVPEMPKAAIEAVAMAAFPTRKSLLNNWGVRVGALAAAMVLGVGGFMAVQSYQTHQQALMADADAFAAQLLSESF